MKTTCQILIIVWLVAFFFRLLWNDFNGASSREPKGFWGAVASVLTVAIFTLVLWGTGAFSGL